MPSTRAGDRERDWIRTKRAIRGLSGGELITYSLGGYAMLTGSPDREPLKAYGSLVEFQAGAQLALGVMAALLAREVTGTGQVVDCAAMQAATFLLGLSSRVPTSTAGSIGETAPGCLDIRPSIPIRRRSGHAPMATCIVTRTTASST
ncbi:CoA transferase [Candidatus Amarobacter glycogenicus]|uniref:CoA transferase n=1 Tax=Candidatus Amarobacter glycogenicus TaxID=3140699 RepID=UPI002A0ED809|nr:CoA transferase [Dehalococcoidia bacterium]